MNKKKALALYHRNLQNYPWMNLDIGQIYETGEGCRVDYRKSIHHFRLYLKFHRNSQDTYLELATIFESAKGFIDKNRALHHLCMAGDIRRDWKLNRRVASYFVRGTFPRKISFTHQEFQLSFEKIRNSLSRSRQNETISIFSSQEPLTFSALAQTSSLDSPESRIADNDSKTCTAPVCKTNPGRSSRGVVVPEGYSSEKHLVARMDSFSGVSLSYYPVVFLALK